MPLDKVDQSFLAEEGSPQDILKRVLDLDIGANNAKKYKAGINHWLSHKDNLDTEAFNDMEEVVIKADGSRTTKRMLLLSEEDSKDPQRVMQLMGYDPIQWELLRCRIRRNYWDVTIKNKECEGVKHTNHAYECEISCKPIQTVITTDYVREVFESLSPPDIERLEYSNAGMLLEFPIMDLHLGKLAWEDETGENYDLKIAERLYKQTVLDILASVEQHRIQVERIAFPIGQDFFHVDNANSSTTKGTLLDTDSRWQKMYTRGVELLIWAIEQLRHIAPVECMYVAGNHDQMLSYCATMTVDAYFSTIDEVSVDLSPRPRKYIQYGNCLIGYSHGVEESKRIEHLMQIEQPQAWGETIFREWHLGHMHSEQAKEVGGIIIRRISSITGTDAWHKEKGFIGAVRKAQAFVWDKELGKRLTIDSHVKA